jgi:DNA (cytosine-5)-methyltransferase 1
MTKLKIGSLFSGYGGLDMAVKAITGGEVIWHCEFAEGPSKILEKNHPGIPNHRDIREVDFTKVEPVDILTGGFPCQDLSHAGSRLGIQEGTRSGLWIEFARAIEELKPRMVVIENVRGLLSGKAYSDVELGDRFVVQRKSDPTLRAMGGVLGDLADLGYDARWASVRASDAGSCHQRFRVFIIAYPSGRTLS